MRPCLEFDPGAAPVPFEPAVEVHHPATRPHRRDIVNTYNTINWKQKVVFVAATIAISVGRTATARRRDDAPESRRRGRASAVHRGGVRPRGPDPRPRARRSPGGGLRGSGRPVMSFRRSAVGLRRCPGSFVRGCAGFVAWRVAGSASAPPTMSCIRPATKRRLIGVRNVTPCRLPSLPATPKGPRERASFFLRIRLAGGPLQPRRLVNQRKVPPVRQHLQELEQAA